ncbi:UNVERIFIED_CONTAM: hypothetical protein K2H54_066438 [Gekko kuhli]
MSFVSLSGAPGFGRFSAAEDGLTKKGAAHFLFQHKVECRFADGTRGEVRYLDRQPRLGYKNTWSRPCRRWNGRKEWVNYQQAAVDYFCSANYGVEEGRGVTLTRKDKPTVRISHTRAGPLAHHSLLICTATGYYPSGVRFKWLKNGQEQTEGVGYADEVQNGDWTFLNQAMLETVPQRGDFYACQVEHRSLKEPITVQWEPRSSNSAQSKVWTGALGAVLGVAFGAAGVSFYLKTRRVSLSSFQQPCEASSISPDGSRDAHVVLLVPPPPQSSSVSRQHSDRLSLKLLSGTAGMAGKFTVWEDDWRRDCSQFAFRLKSFAGLLLPFRIKKSQAAKLKPEGLDGLRSVDAFCRCNYAVEEGRGVTVTRKDQPTVKISHTRAGPLAHHSLLICTATGYYPSGVRFRWLKNGQEQTEGVGYADEVHNGDWTFLNQAMLETVPQRGDLYACQVEHGSRKEPIAVQWEPRSSNSAQSKVWTGALGAVLGVVFGAAGVSFYLKTRRGSSRLGFAY